MIERTSQKAAPTSTLHGMSCPFWSREMLSTSPATRGGSRLTVVVLVLLCVVHGFLQNLFVHWLQGNRWNVFFVLKRDEFVWGCLVSVSHGRFTCGFYFKTGIRAGWFDFEFEIISIFFCHLILLDNSSIYHNT